MDTEQYTMRPEEEYMDVVDGKSIPAATRVERVCEESKGGTGSAGRNNWDRELTENFL